MGRLLFSIIPAFLLLYGCAGEPPKRPPEARQQARQLHENGIQAFDDGHYELALHDFRIAENHFRSIDDAHGIASAAISRAEIHLLFGRSKQAETSLRRAQEAIEHLPYAELERRVALLEARLLIGANPKEAHRHLIALFDEPGQVAPQARLLACEIEVRADDDTGCLDELTEIDTLSQARLAQLKALAEDDPGNKRMHLETALDIYRERAYRPGIATVHEALAVTFADAGENDRAIDHFERALYLRLWTRDSVHAAGTLERLASLADNPRRRARYLEWREAFLDESTEPEWAKIMEAFVTPL